MSYSGCMLWACTAVPPPSSASSKLTDKPWRKNPLCLVGEVLLLLTFNAKYNRNSLNFQFTSGGKKTPKQQQHHQRSSNGTF